MGKYFNEGNESKSHLKAKEKLFDLIAARRVEIVDQHGTQYEIFTNKHNGEFLHIESFVMDYSPNVIFSNTEAPCKKYFDDTKKKPRCDMKGYFGAFKELPCSTCIGCNFKKETNTSSHLASFRPDVAFGYEGKHKVWFEIKNTSPCSEKKIQFCKDNGIVLLEITDSDINNFKEFNGTLKFNKLEEYVHEPNLYEDMELIKRTIQEELTNNKYMYHNDATKKLRDIPSNIENFNFKSFQKLSHIIDREFCVIYAVEEHIKSYLGVEESGKIIINKETYNKLVKLNYITHKTKGMNIVESTTRDVIVKCSLCKGKEKGSELVRTEKCEGLPKIRYYHEECLTKIFNRLK